MKRRTSGSDLSHLLQEQMSVYEGIEQVPGTGVDNLCCRLCIAVSENSIQHNCGNVTVVKSGSSLDGSADSNRYASGPGTSKHHSSVAYIDSENYMLRGIGSAPIESSRSRSYSFTNGAGKVPKPGVPANLGPSTGTYHVSGGAFKKAEERMERPPMDMDMFYVRETGSSLAGPMPADVSAAGHINMSAAIVATLGTTSVPAVSHMPDNSLVVGECVSIPAGVTTSCARTMSFHALFCSCHMSCCCMCGSLCSPDCHACFHSLCVRFAANYVCQRNSDVLQPVTLNHDKVSLYTINYLPPTPFAYNV